MGLLGGPALLAMLPLDADRSCRRLGSPPGPAGLAAAAEVVGASVMSGVPAADRDGANPPGGPMGAALLPLPMRAGGGGGVGVAAGRTAAAGDGALPSPNEEGGAGVERVDRGGGGVAVDLDMAAFSSAVAFLLTHRFMSAS